MVDTALQILLVVLLLLTIVWCVVVHQRLHRLRADRGEMEAFILALGEATDRAESTVRDMRDVNRAAESAVQEHQREARRRSEELARMVDNAVRVINRLEGVVEQGATRSAAQRTKPIAGTTTPTPVKSAERSDERRRKTTRQKAEEIWQTARQARKARDRQLEKDHTSERPQRILKPKSSAASRSIKREGQLDGLLHGELVQALQALR